MGGIHASRLVELQGIASYRVADHLRVGFLLGAERNEASPALGVVDHLVIGFESQ